jgi:hypothetical protein
VLDPSCKSSFLNQRFGSRSGVEKQNFFPVHHTTSQPQTHLLLLPRIHFNPSYWLAVV